MCDGGGRGKVVACVEEGEGKIVVCVAEEGRCVTEEEGGRSLYV